MSIQTNTTLKQTWGPKKKQGMECFKVEIKKLNKFDFKHGKQHTC
jgi:hypothetical protein